MTSAGPTKKTSLNASHRALGARMVPFAGWDMPVQYSGVKAEHLAVRAAAGLFDVSHMGELSLRGEAAGEVIDGLITNNAAKLKVGRALYTCACNERGTILDDLIIYRLAEHEWMVVCNAGNRDKMVAHFAAAAAGRCPFEDVSDHNALLALQGPKAFDILACAGQDGAALATLAGFGLRRTSLFGVAVTVARTGYTGEDGVELFCAWAQAPALWAALLEAGAPHGLLPAGLAARDTLRLEARLSLYGNDIDETTNPFEAGLGWTVKLKPKRPFVGKKALKQIKAGGLTRKLVGFEMRGRGIARQGYPLLDSDEQPIGTTTSGSPAPSLGKNIGLGYVPVAHSAVGSPLVVDCRGRKIPAEVVTTPFYRRA
ncbi:MAG TPA: glycine cleavage system aminomethyltransferase GcvT [Sorangium sp.]|nr:glycine cleavage system aminomethyltransferase GcvT [Sorangium sp.]